MIKNIKKLGEYIGVFYNPDCSKYGVCVWLSDSMGQRWHQIIVQDHTYTKYEKVAERWATKYKEKNGDKIVKW